METRETVAHAAGPWVRQSDAAHVGRIYGPGGLLIADTYATAGAGEANARLIAAAPALADLARDLADTIFTEGTAPGRELTRICEYKRRARVLLAQIDGGAR